jgi:chromosomal replication initiator protein
MRGTLRRAVGEGAWNLWLATLEPGELDGRRLRLHAPDEKRQWISTRYGRLLQATAADVLGAGAQVELVAPGTGAPAPVPSQIASGGGAAARGSRPETNPRLTFEQFVIGESNRLAHSAALSVAELPGMAYNPLFICGPPGLGKTHLLQSIANYIRTYGDGLSVRCTTSETFTNEFLSSIHGGDAAAFKQSHRSADVLLVDDVQFLQSKARTEEEFFHTFNALHAAGAQIVLTSDRPPKDLDALEDRLRERFEAGLVCDVRPPNHETRVTILRKRVQQDGIDNCEPDALEVVATRVRRNIRTLEGALIRVIAFGSLTGRPVTAELADEVLSGLYPDLAPARKLSVEDIQLHVGAAFGLSLEELLSGGREPRLAWPRQIAMHLARELTDQTLPAIGRAFGRGHTTVLHACRRTAERVASDPEAFALVDRLTRELNAPGADRTA